MVFWTSHGGWWGWRCVTCGETTLYHPPRVKYKQAQAGRILYMFLF